MVQLPPAGGGNRPVPSYTKESWCLYDDISAESGNSVTMLREGEDRKGLPSPGALSELACKPDSVVSSHPSERPTWTSAGSLQTVPLGLASGGVCRAAASPRRRCALTAPFQPCLPPTAQVRRERGRCVFCGTFPRVSPGRRYRPPCPSMSGLSSKANLRDCSASTEKILRCKGVVGKPSTSGRPSRMKEPHV